MSGNKLINDRGFLLLEAVLSWLILVTCLMIYLPFLMNMVVSLKEARSEVELTRIGYEQVQKIILAEPPDTTWVTAGKTYKVTETAVGQRKGIRVYEKGQEWAIQMETFTSISTQP